MDRTFEVTIPEQTQNSAEIEISFSEEVPNQGEIVIRPGTEVGPEHFAEISRLIGLSAKRNNVTLNSQKFTSESDRPSYYYKFSYPENFDRSNFQNDIKENLKQL